MAHALIFLSLLTNLVGENSEGSTKLSFKTESGPTLLVDGYRVSFQNGQKLEKDEWSEFKISYRSGKENKTLFEASALDSFYIEKVSNGLVLQELWWFDASFHRAIESRINCGKESCALLSAKCILKSSSKVDSNIMKEIKKARSGQNKDEPLDSLMIRAFSSALAGDRVALSFFTPQERPKDLDGAYGEEWVRANERLSKLKKLNCLR
ncbi:MAG: hypothetical protein JWQ35_2483 [Bacteriovoracaceae bacterium]|nr:hypothetical protein [Bacteriovoracaceae bacterium]